MAQTEFPIEFDIDVDTWNGELQREAERRLQRLADDYPDIIRAAVAATQPAKASTDFIYQVRVAVYMKPDNAIGKEASNTLQGALKGALDAVEKQVRKTQKKISEPWKRADLPGAPGSSTPLEKGDNE